MIQLSERSKEYYFGYFYIEVNGNERILLKKNDRNQWFFPISGFKAPNESITTSINEALKKFIIQNMTEKLDFLKTNFSQPEIKKLQIQDTKILTVLHKGREVQITPIFFKIRLRDKIDFIQKDYFWAKKVSLFKNEGYKSTIPNCGEKNLLEALRKDCILDEYGYRILECVDVIVFKESNKEHNEDYEFLMLYRKKAGEKYGGWEYPKGGLEYHETVHEGAIRELLEETGLNSIGDFRYGGYLDFQTVDVSWREKKEYNTLRVHGITYLFVGNDKDISPCEKEGLIDHKWFSLKEARDKIWIGKYGNKNFDYGKQFFDRWKENQWKIKRSISRPVSVAFQITEKCGVGCKFCHRSQGGGTIMEIEEIKEIIDMLAERGVMRLTFTGGEPLSIGKINIFTLISHSNKRRIHTCLSTTGEGFNIEDTLEEADIIKLENSLDQLLIPVHCLNEKTANKLYNRVSKWENIKKRVELILKWTENLKIITEVCTVVTKQQNLHQVIDIGEWVFNQDDNVFWRVDEYYYNGADDSLRTYFELSTTEFKQIVDSISEKFKNKVQEKKIKFNNKEGRLAAPDVMITPIGNLVTSSNNKYELVGDKKSLLCREFKNRRPWSDYRDYCRTDWDW